MHHNNPNYPPQEDEIDLKELLNLLIKSKKLIILITLICIAVATFYATVLKKPVYESKSIIELNLLLFPNEGNNLAPEIDYYYPEIDVRKIGNSLLILKTNQNSKEQSEIILKEAIDFISTTTEKQLELNLERMNFIHDELLKLSQESNSSPSDSFRQLGLIHQLNELRFLKVHEQKALEQINPVIKTKQLPSKTLIFILIGAIVGFLLSFSIVVSRQSFSQNRSI